MTAILIEVAKFIDNIDGLVNITIYSIYFFINIAVAIVQNSYFRLLVQE